MTIPTARRTPAYRQVAEDLTRRIMDGEMSPGDRLPTEAELCAMFGVNRSTVREATRVLEEASLLRRESAKRLVVSRPSREETGQMLERALVLGETSFAELLEVMRVLEPLAARLAASQAPSELCDALDENIAATELAVLRGEPVATLDVAFHDLVAWSSANGPLALARDAMSRLFYPSFERVLTFIPGAGERMLEAHRAITAAIKAGDGAGAEASMLWHVRDFERGYVVAGFDRDAPVRPMLPERRSRGRSDREGME